MLLRSFFFSSRRRHTRCSRDWSSDVCSSDLFPSWPVDWTADRILERLMALSLKAKNAQRIPFIWFWPDGRRSCAMITHDVETEAGLRFSPSLMDIDDSFGIKTSFQIIPEERYSVPQDILNAMRERGFEINVHDLNHDGDLFRERIGRAHV